MNLYQRPVGDDKKYNGYETQFLVDTAALCSLLNFYSYENLCNVQKLTITPTNSSTIAVNDQRLKILGCIILKSSFDIEGQYDVEHRILVSEKNVAKHNILGMNFLQSCSNNIDLTTPKMDLKIIRKTFHISVFSHFSPKAFHTLGYSIKFALIMLLRFHR